MSSYARKTNLGKIRVVSSQKCCLDECIQKFSHVDTVVVRQRYYLEKFDERLEYEIPLGE